MEAVGGERHRLIFLKYEIEQETTDHPQEKPPQETLCQSQ